MDKIQKIKGFSRYELDMTDFFDVKVFSLNYNHTGRRQQLKPSNYNNHLMLCLRNDEGKPIIMRLHQLVWRQFNGEIPKGYAVHHMNFNPSDNRPENLVLLSCSEHSKLHSKVLNNEGKFGEMKKKCLQFDKTGVFIAEYSSTQEASRVTGIPQGRICSCCNHKPGRNSAGGFIWIYKSEYEKLIKENKWEEFKKNYLKDRRTPVVMLDKEGNFISEFESLTEASKITDIDTSSICRCCKHESGYKSRGGFIFMYKDEYTATKTQHDQ